jgi:hypothetical protein
VRPMAPPFPGRDVPEDVRKRDEVADLFMGPRASNL